MAVSIATALIVSAVITGVGAVLQYTEAKRARSQQAKQFAASQAATRRAEDAQKRAADLQAIRRRRELVREARIRRARAIQGGVSAGAGFESSPILGAAAAVTTDIASTLSFLDQTRALNELARVEFGKARTISATPIKMGGLGALVSTFGRTGLQLAASPSIGPRIFTG